MDHRGAFRIRAAGEAMEGVPAAMWLALLRRPGTMGGGGFARAVCSLLKVARTFGERVVGLLVTHCGLADQSAWRQKL